MDEDLKEELLVALEGASNFCRGLGMFESRIPQDVKQALLSKVAELDALTQKYSD